MTCDEQCAYLIDALLTEAPQYREAAALADGDEASKRRLLRALFNVRPPAPVSEEFLLVQDAYLQGELAKRGVVDAAALPSAKSDARLCVWQGDITLLKADAIVNAANSALLGCFVPGHNCIDNCIHTYAGVQLRLACDALMRKQGFPEPTGSAKITPAFNLPSRYVLHTVGPIVAGEVTRRDCDALASCYRACLALAKAYGCKSVAFCCISTGVFHFPNETAAKVAVRTVRECLAGETGVERVIFNVFNDGDKRIYERLLGADCAGEDGDCAG